MRKSLRWIAASGVALVAGQAQAVPAFSTQTGQPCNTCHVGSFGPELTAFGRNFKLGGYTLQGGTGTPIPVALLALTSYTNTTKGVAGGAAPDFGTNGNFAVDQVSVFLAGRVNDYVGGFIQSTYSGVDKTFFLDNTDIRVTKDASVGDHDLQFGVSLNDSPQVEDVYNSTYTWGYPFVFSALSNTPAAGTLLGGTMAGNSLGLVGYASLDHTYLLEAGAYDTQSPGFMKIFGTGYGAGAETGVAPYMRAAYETDLGPASTHIGVTFLDSRFNPMVDTNTIISSLGHDKYTDVSVDGGAQFVDNPVHQFTTNGMFTHESRRLDGTTALGGAMTPNGDLDEARLTGTYYYNDTYGFTASWHHLWGSRDAALYGQGNQYGSANGSPNSNSYTVEADYVPFGKDSSWGSPFANLKIGVQYTMYTEFNGGTTNYDGVGSNASDNNTLYVFLWTLF